MTNVLTRLIDVRSSQPSIVLLLGNRMFQCFFFLFVFFFPFRDLWRLLCWLIFYWRCSGGGGVLHTNRPGRFFVTCDDVYRRRYRRRRAAILLLYFYIGVPAHIKYNSAATHFYVTFTPSCSRQKTAAGRESSKIIIIELLYYYTKYQYRLLV